MWKKQWFWIIFCACQLQSSYGSDEVIQALRDDFAKFGGTFDTDATTTLLEQVYDPKLLTTSYFWSNRSKQSLDNLIFKTSWDDTGHEVVVLRATEDRLLDGKEKHTWIVLGKVKGEANLYFPVIAYVIPSSKEAGGVLVQYDTWEPKRLFDTAVFIFGSDRCSTSIYLPCKPKFDRPNSDVIVIKQYAEDPDKLGSKSRRPDNYMLDLWDDDKGDRKFIAQTINIVTTAESSDLMNLRHKTDIIFPQAGSSSVKESASSGNSTPEGRGIVTDAKRGRGIVLNLGGGAAASSNVTLDKELLQSLSSQLGVNAGNSQRTYSQPGLLNILGGGGGNVGGGGNGGGGLLNILGGGGGSGGGGLLGNGNGQQRYYDEVLDNYYRKQAKLQGQQVGQLTGGGSGNLNLRLGGGSNGGAGYYYLPGDGQGRIRVRLGGQGGAGGYYDGSGNGQLDVNGLLRIKGGGQGGYGGNFKTGTGGKVLLDDSGNGNLGIRLNLGGNGNYQPDDSRLGEGGTRPNTNINLGIRGNGGTYDEEINNYYRKYPQKQGTVNTGTGGGTILNLNLGGDGTGQANERNTGNYGPEDGNIGIKLKLGGNRGTVEESEVPSGTGGAVLRIKNKGGGDVYIDKDNNKFRENYPNPEDGADGKLGIQLNLGGNDREPSTPQDSTFYEISTTGGKRRLGGSDGGKKNYGIRLNLDGGNNQDGEEIIETDRADENLGIQLELGGTDGDSTGKGTKKTGGKIRLGGSNGENNNIGIRLNLAGETDENFRPELEDVQTDETNGGNRNGGVRLNIDTSGLKGSKQGTGYQSKVTTYEVEDEGDGGRKSGNYGIQLNLGGKTKGGGGGNKQGSGLLGGLVNIGVSNQGSQADGSETFYEVENVQDGDSGTSGTGNVGIRLNLGGNGNIENQGESKTYKIITHGGRQENSGSGLLGGLLNIGGRIKNNSSNGDGIIKLSLGGEGEDTGNSGNTNSMLRIKLGKGGAAVKPNVYTDYSKVPTHDGAKFDDARQFEIESEEKAENRNGGGASTSQSAAEKPKVKAGKMATASGSHANEEQHNANATPSARGVLKRLDEGKRFPSYAGRSGSQDNVENEQLEDDDNAPGYSYEDDEEAENTRQKRTIEAVKQFINSKTTDMDFFGEIGWLTQDYTNMELSTYNGTSSDSDLPFVGYGTCKKVKTTLADFKNANNDLDKIKLFLRPLRAQCNEDLYMLLVSLVQTGALELTKRDKSKFQHFTVTENAMFKDKRILREADHGQLFTAYEFSAFSKTYLDYFESNRSGLKIETLRSFVPDFGIDSAEPKKSPYVVFHLYAAAQTLEAGTRNKAHSVTILRQLLLTLKTSFLKILQDYFRLTNCLNCNPKASEILKQDLRAVLGFIEFIFDKFPIGQIDSTKEFGDLNTKNILRKYMIHVLGENGSGSYLSSTLDDYINIHN